jgi:SpoVK/Ycf46/Vps4 family AAA+-type ATPase
VQTHEEDRCIEELSNQIPMYTTYVWDLGLGLIDRASYNNEPLHDPISPVQKMACLPRASVLFVKDFHRFIESVDVYRAIKNLMNHMKANDKHLVIISPVIKIPVELEKEITVMDFALPTVDEMVTLAKKMVSDNQIGMEITEEIQQAIAAGKGLTMAEAENAFARSLIATKGFDREIIEEAKLQTIRKSGVMELFLPEPIESLGGVERLKSYLFNRKQGFFDDAKPTPRGILVTGLPGCGKSLSAKVTASIFGFPLLKLDISSLKGSLVGESEQKMRQATQLADAIGEAVIWMDEIEKDIGGVQSSHHTDGGTTSAMFGHLLSWWQETSARVFFFATCNEMQPLLNISQGALLRRFDDIFFMDVPSALERRQILAIMNQRYQTEIPMDMTTKMINWTGAEIEKFVKASVFDGVDEAFSNIHPIYEQNRDNIDKVRNWAKTNARWANTLDIDENGHGRVRRLSL